MHLAATPGPDWPQLETGDWHLRPACAADFASLRTAVTDPRCPQDLPLAGMARENTLAGWLQSLTSPDAATRLWSIAGPAADACIGQIGLIPIDSAEAHWVSYWLSPDWQGRGIAGAALSALCDAVLTQPGYKRLIAMIASGNRASLAVIRRAGFVEVPAPDIPAIGPSDCTAFERRDGYYARSVLAHLSARLHRSPGGNYRNTRCGHVRIPKGSYGMSRTCGKTRCHSLQSANRSSPVLCVTAGVVPCSMYSSTVYPR